MKIAVDLRNLQSGHLSGVENYTINVLERLLQMDKENQYTLFYNLFRNKPIQELHYINSKIVRKKVPNKLLNLSLRLGQVPKFEKLIGNFDCLFLPNMNHFALHQGTKLALTVHDLSPFIAPEFYNLKRRLWHTSLNFPNILKRADLIFAVSEYTKQDLISKFGVANDKITVTPLGVNHELFRSDLQTAKLRHVRNIYNLPGDFILYLGTLEPRKNIVGLIESFNKIKAPVDLVIAGRPGWKYGSIFKAVNESPKKRHIHLLGFVEEVDKPYLLKLAKAFAFPSFYEGFGLPVLEAMAVGTPVVASQVTSIPEVTEDAALLINPNNIDDLARAIEEIVQNQSLRDTLITKGLTRAKHFTWDQTAETMHQAFNTLQRKTV